MPGENVPVFTQEVLQCGVYCGVQLCPNGSCLCGIRWVDLEFDYLVRGFERGGLGSLVEYHAVPVYGGP